MLDLLEELLETLTVSEDVLEIDEIIKELLL
jgi:hypothetical protein